MVLNFFDKIISLSSFPKVENFDFELKKIGILRILIGIVIFYRLFQVYDASVLIGYDRQIFQLISFFYLIIVSFFTIGLFTPIATIILLFSISFFDYINGTSTLGTAITQVAIIPLAIINSGHYYSLDSYVNHKNIKFKKYLKYIYGIFGVNNANEIRRAYFFSFLVYASISFAAMIFHLKDIAWMEGLTLKMILLNSYLSKYYEFFRLVEFKIPFLLSFFSLIAFYIQTIFQLFMLLLIFIPYGKIFIFYWGLIFYTCSMFFINLSSLPHVEIILWIMIFCPILTKKEKLNIYYDDYCNLCKNTMKFFNFINFNDIFNFFPISKSETRLIEMGVSREDISSNMIGIYKSRLISGYNLYVLSSRKNPLLYVFYPLLILGRITRLGPYCYNFISRNRLKYFGRCEISFYKQLNVNTIKQVPLKNSFFNDTVYFIYFSALIIYWLFNPNFVAGSKISHYTGDSHKYLRRLGLDLPNVFNKTDLSMGERWMVIEQFDKEHYNILPITGYNGERLSYDKSDMLHFTNHGTDKLYFGLTLRFRRETIGMDKNRILPYMQSGNQGWFNLEKRIKYDYMKKKFSGLKSYRVQIFADNSNNIKHWTNDERNYNKEIIFQQYYNYDSIEGLSKSADKLF